MLRRPMFKLFVRLLILTTLVSALLLMSVDVTRKTVHATRWCDDICWTEYDECTAWCPAPGQPNAFACARYCRYELEECMATCE